MLRLEQLTQNFAAKRDFTEAIKKIKTKKFEKKTPNT